MARNISESQIRDLIAALSFVAFSEFHKRCCMEILAECFPGVDFGEDLDLFVDNVRVMFRLHKSNLVRSADYEA